MEIKLMMDISGFNLSMIEQIEARLVPEIVDSLSDTFEGGSILEFRNYALNEMKKYDVGESVKNKIKKEIDNRVEFMQITNLPRPKMINKGDD